MQLLRCMLLLSVALHAETVLDINFKNGQPEDKRIRVQGGKWAAGWLVSGDTDRVVVDLVRDIRDGYVELIVTRTGDMEFKERKRNWLGVFANEAGHQSAGGYARAGSAQYGFSKAEMFASNQSATICEKKFGDAADWVMDGKTEHVVRVDVSKNVMTWSNGKGSASCGSDAQPVGYFRWIMLGGVRDGKLGWHHGSLVGLKVLRLKVVDRGK